MEKTTAYILATVVFLAISGCSENPTISWIEFPDSKVYLKIEGDLNTEIILSEEDSSFYGGRISYHNRNESENDFREGRTIIQYNLKLSDNESVDLDFYLAGNYPAPGVYTIVDYEKARNLANLGKGKSKAEMNYLDQSQSSNTKVYSFGATEGHIEVEQTETGEFIFMFQFKMIFTQGYEGGHLVDMEKTLNLIGRLMVAP